MQQGSGNPVDRPLLLDINIKTQDRAMNACIYMLLQKAVD